MHGNRRSEEKSGIKTCLAEGKQVEGCEQREDIVLLSSDRLSRNLTTCDILDHANGSICPWQFP
jgi:hypothetical protein